MKSYGKPEANILVHASAIYHRLRVSRFEGCLVCRVGLEQ